MSHQQTVGDHSCLPRRNLRLVVIGIKEEKMKKSLAAIAALFAFAVTPMASSSAQPVIYFGAYDTNLDDSVGESDALAIIDYLNFGSASPPVHPGTTALTYNVTGTLTALGERMGPDSNQVTALDALLVINFLNATSYQQNPTLAADVNNDSNATALDALLVINYLNFGLPTEPHIENVATQIAPAFGYPFYLGYSLKTASSIPAPIFYDVNGDYKVTESDAYAVIDYLNANN